jgi:hypothetical protein
MQAAPFHPQHASGNRTARHARDALQFWKLAKLIQPPERTWVKEHSPETAPLLGFEVGPTAPPMLPCDQEETRAIETILREEGLLTQFT